jgi:hypothetical protein
VRRDSGKEEEEEDYICLSRKRRSKVHLKQAHLPWLCLAFLSSKPRGQGKAEGGRRETERIRN